MHLRNTYDWWSFQPSRGTRDTIGHNVGYRMCLEVVFINLLHIRPHVAIDDVPDVEAGRYIAVPMRERTYWRVSRSSSIMIGPKVPAVTASQDGLVFVHIDRMTGITRTPRLVTKQNVMYGRKRPACVPTNVVFCPARPVCGRNIFLLY